MNTLVKKLYTLQELDNEITEYQLQIEATLSRLNPIKKEINKTEEDLKSLKISIEEKELERKRLEIEIGKREADIQKYQGQLYGVKTQKEYDALEHEIANLKELNSADEDKVLEIYENLDSDKKQITELNALKTGKEEESKKIQKEIDTDIGAKEETLNQKKSEREKLREEIPDNYLTIYDRIYSKFPGDVLTTIKNNMCMGCRITLPPQVQQEINSSEKVVFCESCSRILYPSEE